MNVFSKNLDLSFLFKLSEIEWFYYTPVIVKLLL